MTTLELNNILNFFSETLEPKAFLLKAFFKEKNNKKNIVEKEFFITDDIKRNESYIYLGKKEDFNLNKLIFAFSSIMKNTSRSYQIDLKTFITNKKITLDDIVKIYIDIWYKINGKQFNLKSKKTKYKSTYLLIDEFHEKWLDYILISTQICEIKTLQNMPPNILTIDKFVSYIKILCKNNSLLKLNILSKKEMKKLGMNLIIGVNEGSKEEAKLIVIEYNGNPNSNQKISFIGKGITFDSGGYNLKTPGKYMLDMKFDMSGAAISLLLVDTLSKLRIKKNISCVIPITDNMVDSLAQLPETILKSMDGRTIEIANTDAEGRLILADAITYAAKILKSSLIIDIATLTGTVVYALGEYTGVWSTNNNNWLLLEKCAKKEQELIWRMPLNDIFLKSLYKTDADILSCSNTDKPDSNIAAAWLNTFACNKDYIHLDIAGSSDSNSKGNAPMFKTLIEFIKSM